MAGLPLVEPFLKTVYTRVEVEAERQSRLQIPGAMSSIITEDTLAYVLTTMLPGPDDPPAVLPGDRAILAPAPAQQPAPASGVFGIDSLIPANAATLTAAHKLFGRAPVLWGRYFYAPGRVNAAGKVDPGHYSTTENRVLQGAGIRVLPIARQTARVGLGASAGAQDAAHNVAALFEVFASAALARHTPELSMFLDCELAEGQPSLSSAYYSAWAAGLVRGGLDASGGAVRLHPAVYASRSDVTTWAALTEAVASGAPCVGAWIAAWLDGPVPIGWSSVLSSPKKALPMPVLAWQYSNKGPRFDTVILSPSHGQALLDQLPVPP